MDGNELTKIINELNTLLDEKEHGTWMVGLPARDTSNVNFKHKTKNYNMLIPIKKALNNFNEVLTELDKIELSNV